MLYKIFHRFVFLVVLVGILTAFKGSDDKIVFIKLQPGGPAITPTEFYIASVIDERPDPKSIGKLISIDGNQNQPALVDFKGGAAELKTWITNAVPVNKNLRGVVVKVNSLKITESSLTGGRVTGQISFRATFYLQRADGLIQLTDYAGNASYQRPPGPAQTLEPLLRSTLNNSLVYFNNWMNTRANDNILLAKGVNVTLSDYNELAEGDTIYYNVNRPLKWHDFQQRAKLAGNRGAEIFASMGYTEKAEIMKGIVNVHLNMKVFAPKSACFVRDDVADAYSLNHEQRHFDIVKIVAERFKQKILKLKLEPGNYDGPINVAFFDALREMDKMQQQYDGETQHSMDTYQQQQWNEKIEKELVSLGVKQAGI